MIIIKCIGYDVSDILPSTHSDVDYSIITTVDIDYYVCVSLDVSCFGRQYLIVIAI